jgi:hypothetical protein
MSETALERSLSPSPVLLVSLLPFEKTLLENVEETDATIADFIDNSRNATAITELFEAWGPAKSVREELEGLEEDLSELEDVDKGTQQLVSSSMRRERCYSAFVGSLSYPNRLNKCRAKSFDENNQMFKEKLLDTLNIPQFVQAARRNVRMNSADEGYWKVIGAMMLRFPEEMKRWISGTPLSFDLLPSRYRFEIWQVTRMYLIHLTNPYAGGILLSLWTSEPHKSLESKIWEEKRSEVKKRVDNLMRLFEDSKVTREEQSSDEPLESDSGTLVAKEGTIAEKGLTVDSTKVH